MVAFPGMGISSHNDETVLELEILFIGIGNRRHQYLQKYSAILLHVRQNRRDVLLIYMIQARLETQYW